MDSLANRVGNLPRTTLSGEWQRHTSLRHVDTALDGYTAWGRWGTANGFPVLYLGRPLDSVVVEAYRHLVDPVMDGRPPLAPRALVTCALDVTEILDLRTATARMELQLDTAVLTSATNEREAYGRCQEVAAVAHQLGLHGLVAPAATTLGFTLALFTDILPAAERPIEVSRELWSELPPDPRRDSSRPSLRLVRD